MERETRNKSTSVHQRLLNKARESSRPFNEILQYFAMERFLYRLSKSSQAEKFLLKGALMVTVWRTSTSRPTKDIDLLGIMNNNIDEIIASMEDTCLQGVEPDGMAFDSESVTATRITEDADYEGIRVRIRGNLGNARISLQIDIGFGDVVVPEASKNAYPTILDFPPPELYGYSMESAIAEKFQAMVKLGALNSRMKDFYDIWLLSHQFDFNGHTLVKAIHKTFENRKTNIPLQPMIIQNLFAEDPAKETQWQAFVKRVKLADAPETLADTIADIAVFLGPVTTALASKKDFQKTWRAPGSWQ